MTRRPGAPARAIVLAVVGLALGADPAAAHDYRPGVLTLVEDHDGFAVYFSEPIESTGGPAPVTVRFPPQCERRADRLRCAAPGLVGEIAIDGMVGRSMKTLVTLRRSGADAEEWLLTAAAPRLAVASVPGRARHGRWLWLWLGVEHIRDGLDHLAFVFGLLLVLRFRLSRRLFATVSAFTVAHSITLFAAALGVVRVAAAPVEACIALSVLLVAREATHDAPTALRRWPWLAAGGFGLIHGLGFASALREVGVPDDAVLGSLVLFNLGVELGQLAFIALTVGLVALLDAARRRLARRRDAAGLVLERGVGHPGIRRAGAYALGAVASWWLLDRLAELTGRA